MSPEGYRDYAEDVYGVVLSSSAAVDFHRLFFDTWTGMREWHDRTVQQARRTGQVVSPLGRVRRVPDIWSKSSYLAGRAERAAINSPVQGMASDLMQMAAASIQGILPGTSPVPGQRLVGTVHDSIVAEVSQTNWEEVTGRMRERMETIDTHLRSLGVDLTVPIVADVNVGTRWGWSDISNPA